MDATKSLNQSYRNFKNALDEVATDGNQKPETIHEAKCLLNDLSKKENVIMTEFWSVILDRINEVSKSLQKESVELETAFSLLKSRIRNIAGSNVR